MSIEDIVICFFKVLFPGITPNKEQVKNIYIQSNELLQKGWTISNITNRIVMADKNNIKNIKSLNDIPYLKKKPVLTFENNLIEDKFYYHYILHKTPEPSIVEVAINGEIIKKSHPFYLELVEFFTLNDLCDYFHNKLKITDKNVYEANKKKINKLLDSYKLDLILFTIDVIYNKMQEEGWTAKVAETIIYNVDEGKERLKAVINNSSGQIKPYYKAYLRLRENGGVNSGQ